MLEEAPVVLVVQGEKLPGVRAVQAGRGHRVDRVLRGELVVKFLAERVVLGDLVHREGREHLGGREEKPPGELGVLAALGDREHREHHLDLEAAHLADLAEEHPGVHLALEAEHLAEDLLDLVVAHLAGLAEDPEEDHLAQEPADQEHRGDLAEKPQEGPAEPAESASLAEQGHTPQQLILDQAHLPAVAQAQEQVRTVL